MRAESNTFGWAGIVCIGLVGMIAGCGQTTKAMPDRTTRTPLGYIWYLDGAGGGRPLHNWSGGIKHGMLDAGYNGAGEMFPWNTGMGVIADQDVSVSYKRSKAAELAEQIRAYRSQSPQAPVTLMGLSAGTSVLVFTLEALPANCQVDNVVLLGASISSNYDLTQALRRVRRRMYVFTSEKDAVLTYLVPMSGTADRERGADPAGLRGFQMPANATVETRAEYSKISYIPWRPEFEAFGNEGGHTDTVKGQFVQHYIAPLVMRTTAPQAQGLTSQPGNLPNPDYDRWASFAVGSWAAYQGHQTFDGKQRPARMVARLVSKHPDKLVVERTYRLLDDRHEPLRVQTDVAPATIAPGDHPLTSSAARVVALAPGQVEVAGQLLDCTVLSIEAKGDYPKWGSDITCRTYPSPKVPGGIVRISLKAHKQGEPFGFDGQLVEYGTEPSEASAPASDGAP